MKTRLNVFLLRNLAIGIAIGWGFLALLFISDLGGIRSMIVKSNHTVMAIGLLMVGFAITFGNAMMGVALMTMPLPDKAPSEDQEKALDPGEDENQKKAR